MHTDFTCIRIVPMHGFMKNSDYSCTVTMHVQKIQKIAPLPLVSTSVVTIQLHYMYICTVPAVPATSSYRYFTSFDKTVPAADQQMSATVQRMSAGVQRMSATVQRMSANFQNKAVSKYFWNMYQLMSAAVHVLRYVLSSGYQMRALHEFTNVSGS